MKLTTETITPEQAAEWLPRFTNKNRRLREVVVASYAADMKAGNWHLTGDPIRWNGQRGIDGQHRLAACVKAAVSFKTVVARGVSMDAHIAIDTGAQRSMADELKYRGEKDTAVLAAVLGMIWRYDNNVNRWDKVSRHAMIDVLNKHPQVRDSLHGTTNKAYLPRTILATTHFLASRDHDTQEADAWLASVRADTGHEEGDPTLALRRFSINIKHDKHRYPRQEEWLAVAIKSFNLWLEGATVHNLRWRKGGGTPEKFPKILPPR